MIQIIDYDVGNLHSLSNAFEYIGASYVVISDPNKLIEGCPLILPGVGAFGDAISNLRNRGFDEIVIKWAKNDWPVLGICVGMQMLFENSEEYGYTSGLQIIPGSIRKMPIETGVKVPNIGWGSLEINYANKTIGWSDPIMNSFPKRVDMYFVHSYFAKVSDEANIITKTKYGNFSFPSIVKEKQVYGCQFHPEKSGESGLALLRNFSDYYSN